MGACSRWRRAKCLLEHIRSRKPYGKSAVEYSSDNESGRVYVLMVGLMVIVMVVVFIGISVTSVHIQHRRLLSCADRLAAVASSVTSPRLYYPVAPEVVVQNPTLPPSHMGASRAAYQALAHLSLTTCKVGERVDMVDVETSSDHVFVSISTRSILPILPPVLGKVVAPQLFAHSSARTL